MANEDSVESFTRIAVSSSGAWLGYQKPNLCMAT